MMDNWSFYVWLVFFAFVAFAGRSTYVYLDITKGNRGRVSMPLGMGGTFGSMTLLLTLSPESTLSTVAAFGVAVGVGILSAIVAWLLLWSQEPPSRA